MTQFLIEIEAYYSLQLLALIRINRRTTSLHSPFQTTPEKE